MFSHSRQTRARIHLYVCTLLCQIAYNIILVLVPFINTRLNANDLQFSLAFSGYYVSMLMGSFNNVCVIIGSIIFGFYTDRYGRKKGLVISMLGLTIGIFVYLFYLTSRKYILLHHE